MWRWVTIRERQMSTDTKIRLCDLVLFSYLHVEVNLEEMCVAAAAAAAKVLVQ